MGRDQQRVEGVGEDETVKRQTRRGGGGCRRCYGLLHINIYDYSDSSVEFSTLFYFLTGSLSISRYFSLTSRVSTNSIFCPIWPCARCACPPKCEETGDYGRCSYNHNTSSAAVSTYLLIYISTNIYTPPGALLQRVFIPESPAPGSGGAAPLVALLSSPVTPHLHLSSVSQLQLHCSEAHCVRTSARLCGCRHGQQNIFNCFFMSLFEECYKIEIS